MTIELQLSTPADKTYLWFCYQKSIKAYIEKIWGWDTTWQQNNFDTNLNKYPTYLIIYQTNPIGYLQIESRKNDIYISIY